MTAATTVQRLAATGLLAPALLVTVSLVHSLARRDHALLNDPISALGAGASGWMQIATFAASGAMFIAFAVGLHLGVAPRRGGIVGPVLVALFGLGIIGLAVFPAIGADGRFAEDDAAHNMAALLAFSSAAIAPFALAWRFAPDEAWRSTIGTMRVIGVVLIVLYGVSATLVVPPDAALRQWFGLSQWAFIAVWSPTVFSLAWRLLSLSVREA